jgi:hypothetical protein
MSEELQRIEPMPVSTHNDDPMSLLTLAVTQGANVDTLERLAALREKFLAEKARKAYFDALAGFQSECPVIVKSNRVIFSGSEKYRYAPIDQIIKVVSPLLRKWGFAYQRDSKIEGNMVEAIVTITHCEGHSETKSFKVPTDSSAGMSAQQKYGAALTFADRYAFCGALGIKTGDQDNDANGGAKGKTVTELKAELWALLKEKRGKGTSDAQLTNAQQWLWDECCLDPDHRIQDLDAAGLQTVITKAKEKLLA